jgi:hypothetical protein
VTLLWRPPSRRLSRILSLAVAVAWLGQMGLLVRSAYLRDSAGSLATDVSRYGSGAQWKGVYYRGEKIGFIVSQMTPTDTGFELAEDGSLQMRLLGATTAARLRTRAQVAHDFSLRSFVFSMDPGSGPIAVEGTVDGRRLTVTFVSGGSRRTEVRELPEPPALSLNLSRRLAAEGLKPGARRTVQVFDPATMRNAPMELLVHQREVVRAGGLPVPAFKVEMTFSGITQTAWVTDTGEVVREESGLGLMVVKETRAQATALAVPGQVQADLMEAAAVVPSPPRRIDEPTAVQKLRVRLEGFPVGGPDLQGAGQTVDGNVFEVVDARQLTPGPADPEAARFLDPEPLLESDDPAIVAEAQRAVQGVKPEPRARAERLVRHVNALLEKKPTVSLPSAAEVLRTRVGDCNEHTALYVALARALGIPARIAVGLVHLRGAFYYHAWPEVYVAEGRRGLWLPADPTLNQFPADATHLRLARGGLDKQAAILPAVGRARMSVLELKLAEGATPILVGRPAHDLRPLDLALPKRDGGRRGCWSAPPA